MGRPSGGSGRDASTFRRMAHASRWGDRDAHRLNIVAAQREPWLRVDPSPSASTPWFDVGAARMPVGRVSTGNAGGRCSEFPAVASINVKGSVETHSLRPAHE